MIKVTVDRRRLRARMIEEDKNNLIRALKADDAKAAKQALTGMSGPDLGLGHEDFRTLTGVINSAISTKTPGEPRKNMDVARQLLGVGENTPKSQMSTQTHNPVTNQPWSSGPVKDDPKRGQQKQAGQKQTQPLNPNELQILRKFMGMSGIRSLSEVAAGDIENFYSALCNAAIGHRFDPLIQKVEDYYKAKYGKDVDTERK